jgi:hypothetical protein
MNSDLIADCNEFLKKDKEGFSNPDFKHAQFIVGIMSQSQGANVYPERKSCR